MAARSVRRPSAEARITYSDGLFEAKVKGPKLEERVPIFSHRLESAFWFVQPQNWVLCNGCGGHGPQWDAPVTPRVQ